MRQEICTHYAGYVIHSNPVQLIDKSWRCAFVILEGGVVLLSAGTSRSSCTRDEAEQDGITVAAKIVDRKIAESSKQKH